MCLCERVLKGGAVNTTDLEDDPVPIDVEEVDGAFICAIFITMKKDKTPRKPRNWLLVGIASILLVLGLILVVIAIANISTFGWWSLLIGCAGLTTFVAALMSIVKNDPSWILLNLIY